jgi:hypothetical protein
MKPLVLLLFLGSSVVAQDAAWLSQRHKEWDKDHKHWHYALNKPDPPTKSVTKPVSHERPPHDDPKVHAKELWFAPNP